jgi:hypothetical protein
LIAGHNWIHQVSFGTSKLFDEIWKFATLAEGVRLVAKIAHQLDQALLCGGAGEVTATVSAQQPLPGQFEQ